MTTKRRAAVYLRISLDHTGEGLAIDRQRDDCERIIRERGWTRVAEYVDRSISASDARKNRPAYDELVSDHAAGRFDALVCYDLDRLTRQPRQLEDWIDAAEDRGLAIVTANGEADLSTDGGRMFARVKAAVARSEVERKSARQRDAARQRASLGRPPLGVRLTGYAPDGAIVEDEAALIRRMFELFDAGESLKSIVDQLSREGTATRRGRPWNPSTVRGILTNPRYAGRAIYCGAETGQRGTWQPIVSDELYNVVNARLTDPRRRTQHGTDRRHLGSGLYLCGICEHPVASWSGARYRCRGGGCVNRSMRPCDAYVTAVVSARLRLPDSRELLAPTEADTAPLVAAITHQRQRLESIASDYDAGLIDGSRYAVATAKVRAELRQTEGSLSALSSSSSVAATLLAPDPGEAFETSSLMARRAVIDALVRVRLMPGTRHSRTFDPATVEIAWRAS